MSLAVFDVVAGDFGKTKGQVFGSKKFLITDPNGFGFKTIEIDKADVEAVDLATEENVIALGGAAGWGAAGAVLLGPAGLLAGMLLGGRGKKTTFIVLLNDGRKFIGQCKTKHFARVLALGM